MHSILSAISTEKGTEGLRCLSFRCFSVGRTNEAAPGGDGVDADKFHANDDIAHDELLQVREERLVLVLAVELLRCVAVESRHLQLVNLQATALNSRDDLTHLGVAVGLDHGEGALARTLEIASGVDVAVVQDAEHAGQDSDLGTDIEVFEGNRGRLLALQELAVVFDVKHLNRLKSRVVEQAVRPGDFSLLVVPLRLEGVLLMAQGRCLLHNELEKSLKQFTII